MLVLSRRENQKIVFPSLDISVDVIRVAGKVVRIGVEAPRDVRVWRGELAEQARAEGPGTNRQASAGSDSEPVPGPVASDGHGERGNRHELRNRLNKAMLGLQVLQMRLDQESISGADQTITQILENLDAINRELSAAEGQPPADAPDRSASCTSPDSVRRNALIVDDSRNEAELMAQLLELNGYRVEIVGNGREALAWLRNNPHPDVVLMDMNMPEMGGAEAIRTIREDSVFDRLRVFGVSGLEQDEAGVQGGVDRWFTKPVRADRLIRAIDQNADSTAV